MSDIRPLKERIREYVEQTDYVSFAELDNHFGISGGDHTLETVPNLFLWIGMTAEAANAINELLAEHAVYCHPSSLLVYLIDGRRPDMPIPKRMPGASGFKKPHWAPVTLRTVPFSKKRRGARQ
jgi:hypothetical protein